MFTNMCNIVGISPDIVILNDGNCGGAQYLLKNTSLKFWQKVERDCEALYVLMDDFNNKRAEIIYTSKGKKRSECLGIQAWCADMWSVFWNALLINQQVKIESELNFCWANDSINYWHKNKILHYTGNVPKEENTVFRKANYIFYPPYYDMNLASIGKENCSYPLVNLITELKKEMDKIKIDLNDTAFVIPIHVANEIVLDNLYITIRYLEKYFITKILVIETDVKPRIDKSSLPIDCNYFFIYDESKSLNSKKINHLISFKTNSEIVVIYDANLMITIEQIVESVEQIRNRKADLIYPFNDELICIDSLFKEMICKCLDQELLINNLGKFRSVNNYLLGRIVFINREKFVIANNSFFTSSESEEEDREGLIKNWGYKINCVKGLFFHLPEECKEN